MAFHLQTFKTRTLTAILFVAVMLLGLLWNSWLFVILFTIIHFGCWYEFVKLMKKIHGSRYLIYCLFGLVYITLPVLLLMNLSFKGDLYTNDRINEVTNTIHFDSLIACAIIFSIWINDTMAYITGSFIGKTPFSKISPKKTWEGTIGGSVLCIAVMGAMGYFIPAANGIGVVHWLAISSICAVFGTAGDLLESKIKRMAKVKDSGTFMPGHGGFLDRFDSFLAAVPFVWLYMKLVL